MDKRVDELDKLAALRDKAGARVKAAQSKRAADWARVKADYPDHAEVITAISKGFGKPARVRVTAGGKTILDSMRYE